MPPESAIVKPFVAFTDSDIDVAHAEWGCNCGPAALAACLNLGLDDVRPHLGDFEARGYMTTAMVRAALVRLGARVLDGPPRWPNNGLVRIQFEGPWTEPGASPRWAARFTHWIAFRRFRGWCYVFDVNSGWLLWRDWRTGVAPRVAASYPRSTGGWHATDYLDVLILRRPTPSPFRKGA